MENYSPELIPVAVAHADAIQILASDPDIAATTRIPHPYPEGAAIEYVHMSIRDRQEGKSYAFAIMHKKTLVGVCALMDVEAGVQAELGYWIGKPYWGKGYASFAVRNILTFAFEQIHLQKVFAILLETNRKSLQVLIKNGFNFQYKQAHNSPKWPTDEKICLYELTRQAWLQNNHQYL